MKIGDIIQSKYCPQIIGQITKITKEYIFYKDLITKIEQPIHISNIKSFIKIK